MTVRWQRQECAPAAKKHPFFNETLSDKTVGNGFKLVDFVPCRWVVFDVSPSRWRCPVKWAAPAYFNGVLEDDHLVSFVCIKARDKDGRVSDGCSNFIGHEGGDITCLEGWPGVVVPCG